MLLDDEHGPVAVYGLPYLDPRALREPWGLAGALPRGGAGRGHDAGPAPTSPRARRGTRSVVLAHAFVAGGRAPARPSATSASAGSPVVPTSASSTASTTPPSATCTVAHTLTERVRYSGSPLAYSFSEAAQPRAPGWSTSAPTARSPPTFVDAPVPRPLARLRGTLEDLLADPALAVHEDAWVQATLTDAVRPLQAMERLRAPVPAHAGARASSPTGGDRTDVPAARPGARSDHDDRARLRRASARRARHRRRVALLRDAFDACCEDPDLDVAAVGPRAVR